MRELFRASIPCLYFVIETAGGAALQTVPLQACVAAHRALLLQPDSVLAAELWLLRRALEEARRAVHAQLCRGGVGARLGALGVALIAVLLALLFALLLAL